jgi:hypothetical protein
MSGPGTTRRSAGSLADTDSVNCSTRWADTMPLFTVDDDEAGGVG